MEPTDNKTINFEAYQRSRNKSLESHRKPIHGELYPNRKKKQLEIGIKNIAICAAIIVVGVGTIIYDGDTSLMDAYRKDIAAKHIVNNNGFGGVAEFKYGEDFVHEMGSLSNRELNALIKEAEKSLKEIDPTIDTHNSKNIVEYLAETYEKQETKGGKK